MCVCVCVCVMGVYLFFDEDRVHPIFAVEELNDRPPDGAHGAVVLGLDGLHELDEAALDVADCGCVGVWVCGCVCVYWWWWVSGKGGVILQ